MEFTMCEKQNQLMGLNLGAKVYNSVQITLSHLDVTLTFY